MNTPMAMLRKDELSSEADVIFRTIDIEISSTSQGAKRRYGEASALRIGSPYDHQRELTLTLISLCAISTTAEGDHVAPAESS